MRQVPGRFKGSASDTIGYTAEAPLGISRQYRVSLLLLLLLILAP